MTKYTINPDGTVNIIASDIKSDIRPKLNKYGSDKEVEVSEDMMDYDNHKLFK